MRIARTKGLRLRTPPVNGSGVLGPRSPQRHARISRHGILTRLGSPKSIARWGPSGQPLDIEGESFRHDLQRHLAVEPRVAGAIDFAHAPAPMGAVISYTPRRSPIVSGMPRQHRKARNPDGLTPLTGHMRVVVPALVATMQASRRTCTAWNRQSSSRRRRDAAASQCGRRG